MKRRFRARIEEQAEPLNPERFSALRRMILDGGHRLVVSFGGGSLPGLCGNLALARILEELELREHVTEIWATSVGTINGLPLLLNILSSGCE